MDSKKSGAVLGINFFELMFLMFLGLKISGLIDWSWWWVFAPIWVPILAFIILVGLAFLGAAIWSQGKLRGAIRNDKKNKK